MGTRSGFGVEATRRRLFGCSMSTSSLFSSLSGARFEPLGARGFVGLGFFGAIFSC